MPRGTSRGFSSRNAPQLCLFQRGLEILLSSYNRSNLFFLHRTAAERLYWHEIAVTITSIDLRDPTPEILSCSSPPWGQKRTFLEFCGMSAVPPKAEVG